MKKQKPNILSIIMTLSDDLNKLDCKSATNIHSEIVLASALAGAVIATARKHSNDPHIFAQAVCGTIMEFIDTAEIIKPNQQLS